GSVLYAMLYGLIHTAVILVVLILFFPQLDFTGANPLTVVAFMLLGSFSFVGIGMIAAILPLLYVERGAQMTFVLQSCLLLVSGVYYSIENAHAEHAALGREPARVVAEDRGSYLLVGGAGEQRAAVSGRFRFQADEDPAAFPAVGDWVAVEGGMVGETVIHALLPRRTALVRQAPGRRTEAQVVGANLDIVFVVASLNAELNLRRLERYVSIAWESGAEPVVLLTKADLQTDVDVGAALADVTRVAAGAAVIVVSSVDGRGVDEVRARIG